MANSEPNIRYTAVGLTDVGRVREHNEDNFLAVDLAQSKRGASGEVLGGAVQQRGLSLVVADGMGGAAAGEVASQMAVDTLLEQFKQADLGGTVRAESDVIGLLEGAINKANESIFRKGQESKDHQGMGTTLTASVVLGDSLYLSQVGDSRGYLLRKGKLVQMTRDQSLIGQLIEEGTLTEEQAEKLGGKNIILQALGVEETLKIDSKRYEILRGDTLLLCSDGLTGMANDELIEKILTQESDLATAAKKLIEAANMGGGKDNITCILARFEGEGLREPLTPLTDADKAGGSFHAPPPPKSKAGRNAAIATAAILGVGLIWLNLPKPVDLMVGVAGQGLSAADLVVRAAPDGGDPSFKEMAAAAKPGAKTRFSLPRKQKFEVVARAPGYTEQKRLVSTAVDYKEILEDITLVRVPATSLDFVAPSYRGKPLTRVSVKMVGMEMQTGSNDAMAVIDGPEYKSGFPAGKWKLTAIRPGFADLEKDVDVPSGTAATIEIPEMTEKFGTLAVTDASPGSVVVVLDGTEELARETVLATRSTPPMKVRATDVTVKVTKPGYVDFEDPAKKVEADAEAKVSMANEKAAASFKGAAGTTIKMTLTDQPSKRPWAKAIPPQGVIVRTSFEPGTWAVSYQKPGEIEWSEPVNLVLEPGQLLVDVDVTSLR